MSTAKVAKVLLFVQLVMLVIVSQTKIFSAYGLSFELDQEFSSAEWIAANEFLDERRERMVYDMVQTLCRGNLSMQNISDSLDISPEDLPSCHFWLEKRMNPDLFHTYPCLTGLGDGSTGISDNCEFQFLVDFFGNGASGPFRVIFFFDNQGKYLDYILAEAP